jgi:hypothetical protein
MRVDNKEETIYRTANERKSTKKHKGVISYLKNIAIQKDNRKTVCGTSPNSSWGRGSQSLHLKVSQTASAIDWQT